ncbi:hypothetical protein Bbelb_039150 [Branchiostoma belcheri]|nr:hypothetical protein Bbelb_039150 [Branchiostoma belcheri]
MIDVSPDFKRDNCRLGGSERSLRTPVARTLPGPKGFGSRRARGAGPGHFPPAGAPGTISTGRHRRRSTEELPGSSAGMVTGLDRGSAPRQPAWSAWIFTWNKIVNLRHAARDTLLFYTEHRCWHIRLCPVRAKLPAPANDSGFRTVETISVHGEGFIYLLTSQHNKVTDSPTVELCSLDIVSEPSKKLFHLYSCGNHVDECTPEFRGTGVPELSSCSSVGRQSCWRDCSSARHVRSTTVVHLSEKNINKSSGVSVTLPAAWQLTAPKAGPVFTVCSAADGPSQAWPRFNIKRTHDPALCTRGRAGLSIGP